jgi:3-oxoacyl-[acyl-carrier protein] reductase
MQSDLAGRTFLVTGASGGIGQATARLFAADGARVVLHYPRNGAAAEALAAELGGNAVPLAADLRSEEEVDRLFAQALARLGRLDGIVVNAGVWREEPVPLWRMSLGEWRETLESDLTSAFLTCRGFLRQLHAEPRDEASIVLIGSTAALFGEENHADYSAAKSAMSYGLTRTLKNEIVRLAPRGRVNCVCPGWVMTPMSAATLEGSDAFERVTATMALRKVATAEDIARAIVYLCSPLASGHVTGQVITVAGGMEGRLLHP